MRLAGSGLRALRAFLYCCFDRTLEFVAEVGKLRTVGVLFGVASFIWFSWRTSYWTEAERNRIAIIFLAFYLGTAVGFFWGRHGRE
jgi:hypothetical protein